MSGSLDLSEKEFLVLRDIIHEAFGLYFKPEKFSFLRMRLSGRVEALGLNSFGEYIQLLRYGPGRERELSVMVAHLTNNETYFFREQPQLSAYRDVVLSELRDRKMKRQEKRITVVSAGCSTGEEPYTLAMLTYETGWFFWGWDVRVLGIDVSARNLEVARRAEFYERSVRMMDPRYLEKFFSRNSGGYVIKDSVAVMSYFTEGNITNPSLWQTLGEVDVIFCRNVMIYFSEDKVRQTVDLFHRALGPGGYLFLGHSETLTDIHDGFDQVYLPGTIIYRRR